MEETVARDEDFSVGRRFDNAIAQRAACDEHARGRAQRRREELTSSERLKPSGGGRRLRDFHEIPSELA
jgi:hypothetical protein